MDIPAEYMYLFDLCYRWIWGFEVMDINGYALTNIFQTYFRCVIA